MAKLALVVAYDAENGATGNGYGADSMADVIANGDGYFNTTSYAADVAEMNRISGIIYDNRLIGSSDPVSRVNTTDLGGIDFSAIYAYTFTSSTGVSILVFRGTQTFMDNVDVAAMVVPFAASGMGQKKWISAWRDEAGLPWTYRQDYNSKRNAAWDRQILRTEGKSAIVAMYSAAGLSSIIPSGLAAVCVQIAVTWYQQATLAGLQTAITGHSLGGSRAIAASMKLRESNITVPTVTFGSVGSACWTRTNYFGYSLMNSSKMDHPQVTEYVHPLDTWGNALGRDVGTQCYWGKANVASSMAKKYCEPISGLDMAYLNRIEMASPLQAYIAGQRTTYKYLLSTGVAAQVALGQKLMLQVEGIASMLPGFLTELNETELTHRKQHRQCRYFTHESILIHEELLKELKGDGTTTSGCVTMGHVEWGNEMCPWNYPTPSDDDDDFWTGKPGGPIFIVFIVITFIALVWSITRCWQHDHEHGDSDSEDFDEWQATRDRRIEAEIAAERRLEAEMEAAKEADLEEGKVNEETQ
eukprot:TRINITY_DN649_c0_g1_i10.p1 TRINITY_DN649_c0_g1~~TRINITY_DN649_c0_g1_i10.p1  ORF type:complete len:617 (+),score=219.89 TRINITY_DN649_c0_g1_i10:268-1851(+)